LTKPIEGVSERILSCAKEGFLEKGYADASLRTIAAKAETTTGSIYLALWWNRQQEAERWKF